MRMDKQPFEDAFPFTLGDFPSSHVTINGRIPLSARNPVHMWTRKAPVFFEKKGDEILPKYMGIVT